MSTTKIQGSELMEIKAKKEEKLVRQIDVLW